MSTFLRECSQAEKRGHKSTDPLFSQVRARNSETTKTMLFQELLKKARNLNNSYYIRDYTT